jgi:molybdate transport system permease protein
MDLGPLALSLEIATIATVLAAVVGLSVAALLANARFPGRDVVDVLFTAPLVLPPTVLGYFLLVALGRRSMVGELFERVTGHAIVFTRTGAVLAAAVGALPFIVRFGRAALEDVDVVYMHAARTLGASQLRALFTVQVPLARRGLVAALMLGFARSLGDFGVTLMVAGDIPGETQTAALAIYDAIQAQREGDAYAMVLVLTLAALTALYAVGKLTRKERAVR